MDNKKEILKFLKATLKLAKSGLKIYKDEGGSASDMYRKGMFEGQRKLAKALINKIESQEDNPSK